MSATVTVQLVRNAQEHAEAKARLRALMDDADAQPDEIAAQAQLIEGYERQHFPIPAPDPIAAIQFRMEQEGLDRSDLAQVLRVQRGRVSELLNGKRSFTVEMLRALHRIWRIPAESLLAVRPARRLPSVAAKKAKRSTKKTA